MIFFKRSITYKLIFYFLLLSLSGISVVGIYSYFSARKALVSRTFDQLITVREVRKYQIENFFNDRLNDINIFAGSKDINSMLQNLEKYPPNNCVIPNINFVNNHLINYIKNCGYYDLFMISDSRNYSLYSIFNDTLLSISPVKSIAILSLIKKIKTTNTACIQDFMIDSFNKLKPSMYIGAPILSGKSIKGYLILMISQKAIDNIMLEISSKRGLGSTGESYLVGNDYMIRSNSRFKPNSVLRIKVHTEAAIDALSNRSGTKFIRDYRGINVLSSYSKISVPGLNWAILAEIDTVEAMRSIYSTRNDILFLSILISLFVIALAYISARRISSTIIRLRDTAARVGDGEFPYSVIINSQDEIGDLSRTFNMMIRKLKEEKQNRLSAVFDGEEKERQRLSRDLHDGLGQYLIAIKMKLQSIDDVDFSKQTEEINKLFNNTIEEARRISNNLMPLALDELGLIAAIKSLISQVAASSGIKFDFDSYRVSDNIDIKIAKYLYRIIQEAINNIVKHSEATEANLQIMENNGYIIIIIEDNGKGFALENVKSKGNGIYNMTQRVNILGGKIDIESNIKKGTLISVRIPLNNQADISKI
ncbi:MAG: histidine kinase [Bacteroidota bacterium]|nr:histidine kinase [Bacteroidota bacterium]